MKMTEIVEQLRKAATDMESLATTDGDLDYPDEIVLPPERLNPCGTPRIGLFGAR